MYNLIEYTDNYSMIIIIKKNVEIAVPLKQISNFWRTLEI